MSVLLVMAVVLPACGGEERNRFSDFAAFAATKGDGENNFTNGPNWSIGDPDISLVDAPEGWTCKIAAFVSEKDIDFTVEEQP